MKNFTVKSLLAAAAVSGIFAFGGYAQKRDRAQAAEQRDLYSDTWVATDAVGRAMPLSDETGGPKDDRRRVVGIFYITWHTQGLADLPSPYGGDVTKILDWMPTTRCGL